MEHEDNAHLDNFLQSSPHLMENLQMASGDGMCDNVLAEDIGGNIGGKFEEHGEHDDEEEWKYIKEGQQNEKQQQQMKAGIVCKDVEGVEVGNGHGNEYELGDVGADDMLLLDKHEVGNGVDGISAVVSADAASTATGIEGNEEIFKNDGDFSTTSNTTSTAGDDVDADTGVLQVEMEIASAPIVQLLPQQDENVLGGVIGNKAEETEEDEPNSLATNNTNGTNSLSENLLDQQLQENQFEQKNVKGDEFSVENKENDDPFLSNSNYDGCIEDATRPHDLDFETHSQLNPNALEFVPSFGSNPASPTVATIDNISFVVGELTLNNDVEIQSQPHPSAIARHLLEDDDFVAQSPRKGSGESNLDAIALPEENDFEHEAAKRPHELEQEENLIGVGTVHHSQQQSNLLLEQIENHNTDGVQLLEVYKNVEEGCLDYLPKSTTSLIDHGPETSVDLDADIVMQSIDVEKVMQKHELTKDEPIEDVLNTVQPLPMDAGSLNTSFVEEPLQELAAAGKELLDVEEKENISHSPSTEEMEMNFKNEIHSSIKDIQQIPIDMDNAAHMHESFYIESTSSDARKPLEQAAEEDADITSASKITIGDEINVQADKILIFDSRLSLGENMVPEEVSFDATSSAEPSVIGKEVEIGLDAVPQSLNIFASEFTPGQKAGGTDVGTYSPMSTEEKHMVEETKELLTKSVILEDLEQKMDELKLSTKDGILSQVEEVAQTAAPIVESLNPFAAPEPEQHYPVGQMPIETVHLFPTESQPHSDFSQLNEQFYRNEQQERHQTQEEGPETVIVRREDNLFSTQLNDQTPASPAKLERELNGLGELIAASVCTAAPVEPEPALEETSVAHPEEVTVEPKPNPVSEAERPSEPESALALDSQPIESEYALQVSSDGSFNVFSRDEPLLVISEEPACTTAETTLEPAVVESTEPTEHTVVTAAAVGAIAATTAAAIATKKTDIKKPRTPTSTKSKPTDIKKTAEPIKKPVAAAARSSVSAAPLARPRTAPSKTTTTFDKKLAATAVTTKPSTTTAARKPLNSTAATSRTVSKATPSGRPTTAPTAAKPSTLRASTMSTTRRSAPISTGGSTTTSNGTAKPKPPTTAPTKPTTLGLTATTKPKLASPRTTLTSQLRKTAPANTYTGLTTARSPLKTTALTTNGVTKSSTTTMTASRAKSSTSTTITTTTTKTFTARPAPKTTHSSTLSSTTTRRAVGTVPSSSTIGTRPTSNTLQKRTPPSSTRPTAVGKSSLSPTKPSSAALKSKTKDVTKKPVTQNKSANEIKKKPAQELHKANGTAIVGTVDELGDKSEQQSHLNGEGDGPQNLLENGMHHAELENGGSLLEQGIQVSLVDA